jgi:hypothetical protein
VVVDVGLASMLMLEVLVRQVSMLEGSVIVLMLVYGAEMLESTRHLVVIVGDVEVTVRVRKSLVTVLLPSIGRSDVCHFCTSHRRVKRDTCSTRACQLNRATEREERFRVNSNGLARRRWILANRVGDRGTGGAVHVA